MKIRTRILIYYTSAFIAIITLIGYFMLNSITNYIIKNTVNNLIDNIYINREINVYRMKIFFKILRAIKYMQVI
ncbi:hypothetical protein SAMN02745195_01752 [Thermoanaerobacter uzonensis DSM 18761]|uniref:Uncharacterized protein n=1 Tax=Thermoanaerobacter uzonensis DSM 18761 TaxID=1123369 RepID=A0A1M4YIL3_9THEO|nr:hypothetical protein [Thermoanaerobacter uzonensis]SHF05609.1 hypothetical protein SAMN02745195_01752 [Thermoanaerobacter uzonensis DSM 18761]